MPANERRLFPSQRRPDRLAPGRTKEASHLNCYVGEPGRVSAGRRRDTIMRDASRRLVKKQETAAKPPPGPAGTALWLEVLTLGYFPFLALVCLGMAGLMVLLVVLARSIGFFFWPLLMPAGVLFLALLHVVLCLRVLFVRIDEKDPMELRWP